MTPPTKSPLSKPTRRAMTPMARATRAHRPTSSRERPIPYTLPPQGYEPPTPQGGAWVPTPLALRPDVRALIELWASQDDDHGPVKTRERARANAHKGDHAHKGDDQAADLPQAP